MASAAPAVSGIEGILSDGSALTITGTGFGATGPTILLFDNFEGGINGSNINTGVGSATIGQWSSLSGTPPKYDNGFKVSGGMAFRGDATINSGDNSGSLTTAYVSGFNVSDIFISYWFYLPTTSSWPVLNGTLGNMKLSWVYGANTVTDDRVILAMQPSGEATATNLYLAGNDNFQPCTWPCTNEIYMAPPLILQKGKWYRFWAYLHGTGDTAAHEEVWVASPSGEAGITAVAKINRTAQIWNSDFANFKNFRLDGFERWCNTCAESALRFDDVYISTGSGARARVEIGDATTYATSKNLSIATVTLWSDTSITATIRQGSFPDFNNTYLYVIDADGNVNADGYLLTTADTTPPSAPTGLVVM